MADQPVEVSVLTGSGSAEALLCATITLPSPALEIKEIRKIVIIDACVVVPDKVIIDGRLRKDINYKTLTSGIAPPAPGTVTACGGIINQASGALAHTTVDIAFNLFIPVAGARPGDTCTVLQALVEGESEEPIGVSAGDGTFTQVNDKSIVLVCIKVTREAVMVLSGACPVPPVCPPQLTAGTPQTKVAPVAAGTTPGTIHGSFIGPVITFPGATTEGMPGTIPPTTVVLPDGAVTFTETEVFPPPACPAPPEPKQSTARPGTFRVELGN